MAFFAIRVMLFKDLVRYFITDIYPALEALKTDSRLYTKTAFIDEHKKGDLSLFSAAIFRFPAF